MYTAFVIVLLIIIVSSVNNARSCESYLYGHWVADDAFCEQSGVDSLMIFIGKPTEDSSIFSVIRPCYIVIMDDVANQAFSLRYSRRWFVASQDKYKITADVKFDDTDLWETPVCIELSIHSGIMTITRDGILYARVCKQHDIFL